MSYVVCYFTKLYQNSNYVNSVAYMVMEMEAVRNGMGNEDDIQWSEGAVMIRNGEGKHIERR